MRILGLLTVLACASCLPDSVLGSDFETDTLASSKGPVTITCIGHGTLMFTFDGKIIHVDPVSRYADYTQLPKADVILVTHEHGDHLDRQAIKQVTKDTTVLALPRSCAQQLDKGTVANTTVLNNGDVTTLAGCRIEAVPAYNVVHTRAPGQPYHPRGVGNGYVITLGDTRIYVAGDTENIPEMAKLGRIDVAFLPMNLPYTMTPEMVAAAARVIKPKILYPYHFGKTDTGQLARLLNDLPDLEIRIRRMQ